MSWEREQIGDCTLYRGDCQEILPTLAPLDAVVTDPPYGNKQSMDYTRLYDRHMRHEDHRKLRRKYGPLFGNDQMFNPQPYLSYSQVILWGANHYSEALPLGSWLCWDKRATNGHALLGEGELAWWNKGRSILFFTHCWHGFARASENSVHLHPTQKPVALMRWCVEKTAGRVCDPYMGSGSTGVACVELGRTFTGIEIDPGFFAIACQRIEEAYKQVSLFPLQPAISNYQEALFV